MIKLREYVLTGHLQSRNLNVRHNLPVRVKPGREGRREKANHRQVGVSHRYTSWISEMKGRDGSSVAR